MPRRAPDEPARRGPRAAALAGALALLAGLVACGDGAEEGRAERAVEGAYDALAAGDADRVCASMSRAARRSYAPAGDGRSSCKAAFAIGIALARDGLAGVRDAEVSGVEVDGDRAVATIEYRGRHGAVKLVKEGGDWRLDTPAPGGVPRPDRARSG